MPLPKLVLTTAILTTLSSAAHAADVPKLPPIQSVQIKSDHLEVNNVPFFPLMSWDQRPSRYAKLHDLGITVHAGDASPAEAAKVGDYAIADFKPNLTDKDHILAYIHGDEPDLTDKKKKPPASRITPETLIAKYKDIKLADPSRPICVTFTAGFMREEKDPTSDRTKTYPQYMNAADIVGFDTYPIYGSGFPTHLNYVGNGVAELKTFAGPKRPVYAWIETCKGSQWMAYDKQPDVLPIHTRNETWQAIINGAAGIGYFTHAWRPTFNEFAPTSDMQKELQRLNAQITKLAPAILAPTSTAAITMKLENNLDCALKATEYKGDTYLFALNRDLGPLPPKTKQFDPIAPRAALATFTIPGLKPNTKIEVLDENRTLTSANGSFTDTFPPLAEHLYRFKR